MGLFKMAGKSGAVAGVATAVAGAVSKRLANRNQQKAAGPTGQQQHVQPPPTGPTAPAVAPRRRPRAP